MLLVSLDLGEIGVDRHVERQVGPHAPLDVEPDVAGAIDRVGPQQLLVVDRAGSIRQQLHVPASRKAQAAELASDRDAVEVITPRHRRKEDLLVLPPNVAQHVDAPDALVTRAVPQRLEGNAEFSFPALLRDAGADGPVGIPVEIESPPVTLAVLPLSRHLAVVLDPKRVGAEDEPVLPIIEGVEEDLN